MNPPYADLNPYGMFDLNPLKVKSKCRKMKKIVVFLSLISIHKNFKISVLNLFVSPYIITAYQWEVVELLDYISVKEAAGKWEISERRVQKLCEGNRIEGVIRFGHSWMVPKEAKKPIDLRKKKNVKNGGQSGK